MDGSEKLSSKCLNICSSRFVALKRPANTSPSVLVVTRTERKNEQLILKGGCQLYAYILHPAKTSPQSHLVRNAYSFPTSQHHFSGRKSASSWGG